MDFSRIEANRVEGPANRSAETKKPENWNSSNEFQNENCFRQAGRGQRTATIKFSFGDVLVLRDLPENMCKAGREL